MVSVSWVGIWVFSIGVPLWYLALLYPKVSGARSLPPRWEGAHAPHLFSPEAP